MAGKFNLKDLGIPIGPPVTKANNKTFLIYGPPGAGKTRLAASASEVEDLSRVLLIDVEAGSASIENVYKDNIDVIRPGDWTQLKDVLEALLNEDHGYQTVIVDTIGKMMEFMKPHQEKRAGNNAFEVWSLLADDTLRFTEMLHRTGMTVIMLAHSESEKDELTGKVTTMPYFLGRKTGKEGPKIFDVIAYLSVDKHPETGDPLRVLQTEGYEGITAKDRTDTIPVLLGDPTMSKIYEYIKAGVPGKGRNTADNTEEEI